MEMHQIRYFLAVAETLNFTRAAEECHVAQPSLSRAVRKLEEELGGDLFRRERARSHLTELGRAMLPLLRQSYEAAIAAKTHAASYGAAELAPLRLALSPTVGLELIASTLAELQRAYPGLELHLNRGSAEAMLEALEAGEVELALVADTSATWERFDRWPLFEEEFVVLSSPAHPLSGRSHVSTADVLAETLIARPYCESMPAVMAELEKRQLTLTTGHKAASDADARTMARQGMGLGLLPRSAVSDREGRPIDDLGIRRTLYVFAVVGRQRSPAASALLSLLRAADWSAEAAPAA